MIEKETFVDQDERNLAAAAHGSILLGVFTNGVGGIFAAMIIWLTQKDKSAYVARQSLEAMVYQIAVLLATVAAFCLWGMLFMLLVAPPIIINPELYQNTPPASLFFGMAFLIFPCGLWIATIFYGIWGAVRCLNGVNFSYIGISRLLDNYE